MSDSGSVQFAQAVRFAARAFQKYAGYFREAEQQQALAPLVSLLRDKAVTLSPVDRDYLADLLPGELGQKRGRPPRTWWEKKRREEILVRVFKIEHEWTNNGKKKPFLEESAKLVETHINAIAKNNAQRVSAASILKWRKELSREERARLRKLAQDKSTNKSDQIYST